MEFSSSTSPEVSTIDLPPTQGRLRHPSQAANHSHSNSLLPHSPAVALTSSLDLRTQTPSPYGSSDRLLGLIPGEDEEKRGGSAAGMMGTNANTNAKVASRIGIHELQLELRKFLDRIPGVWKLRICCGVVVVLLVVGAYGIRRSGAVKRAVLEGTGSCTSPYTSPGILNLTSTNPEDNPRWIPTDSSCTTPPLLHTLRSSLSPLLSSSSHLIPTLELPFPPLANPNTTTSPPLTPLDLPWLQNQTALSFSSLHSVHFTSFCTYTGGAIAEITSSHILSPRPFINGIDEKLSPRREEEKKEEGSRPRVCWIEKWNFMLVEVTNYGLGNRIELEGSGLYEGREFYPPVSFSNRLHHLVQPLLLSLNRSTTPSLIHLSSSLTSSLNYFTKSSKATTNVTEAQVDWYSTRLDSALYEFGITFPGTPLLVGDDDVLSDVSGSMKESETVERNKETLTEEGKKVIDQLNAARIKGDHDRPSTASFSPSKSTLSAGNWFTTSSFRYQSPPASLIRTSLLTRLLERERKLPKNDVGGSKFSGRSVGKGKRQKHKRGLIRIEEWAGLVRDALKLDGEGPTKEASAEYVWCDMFLFELRRAVLESV